MLFDGFVMGVEKSVVDAEVLSVVVGSHSVGDVVTDT